MRDFHDVITALRLDGRTMNPPIHQVIPTADELEVASVLEEGMEIHTREGERCGLCEESWPCLGWSFLESLAHEAIGRGAVRYIDAARNTLGRPPLKLPPNPRRK